MTIFYFTGTGNNLYVAKRIGGTLYSIPQVLKEGKKRFKDDAIGIIFPCYGFGVPRIVREFIAQVKLESDYIFTIMTYGNIAAGGIHQMEKFGAQAGISFQYTNEILMIDNYLPGYKMEDEIAKEQSKNIEERISQIMKEVAARKNQKLQKGTGSKVASALVQAVMAKGMKDGVDRQFTVNDKCTKCGTCVKVCPRQNITLEKEITYHHKCEYCLACVNLCPQVAIHMKNEKSATRFRNANIKLKEIMDANNQKEV